MWNDIPLYLFPDGLTGAAEIIGALEIEPIDTEQLGGFEQEGFELN